MFHVLHALLRNWMMNTSCSSGFMYVSLISPHASPSLGAGVQGLPDNTGGGRCVGG